MSDRPKPIKGFYKPELFVEACEDWLRYLHDGDDGQEPNCDRSEKYEHAAFEIAMEMVYGPEFWNYYNELTKDF